MGVRPRGRPWPARRARRRRRRGTAESARPESAGARPPRSPPPVVADGGQIVVHRRLEKGALDELAALELGAPARVPLERPHRLPIGERAFDDALAADVAAERERGLHRRQRVLEVDAGDVEVDGAVEAQKGRPLQIARLHGARQADAILRDGLAQRRAPLVDEGVEDEQDLALLGRVAEAARQVDGHPPDGIGARVLADLRQEQAAKPVAEVTPGPWRSESSTVCRLQKAKSGGLANQPAGMSSASSCRLAATPSSRTSGRASRSSIDRPSSAACTSTICAATAWSRSRAGTITPSALSPWQPQRMASLKAPWVLRSITRSA
jgi:hypothetical protein